jgi:lipopolysaccharide export LptBFGC system permease protein LptF
MLTVFIVYFYVEWKEKQRLDEADRRREEMFRRAKELREAGLPPHPDSAPIVPEEVAGEDPNDIDEREQLARIRREFRFQFSLRQLLMVLAVAAVVLGLVNFFGSPNAAATMLGVIALAGLVLHAVGVQPPQIVVLGWWLLLLLYVVLTVFATMWSGG